MIHNIDFHSDTDKSVLADIARTVAIPDDVLAKRADEKDDPSTPARCYADPAARLWSIRDKAETWLSLAYFSKTASEDYPGRASVKSILKRAARLWRIPSSEVESLETKLAPPIPKTAAQASMPVLPEAEELLARRREFAYPARQAKAESLLKRASERKETLPPDVFQSLERVAARGGCLPEKALHYADGLSRQILAPEYADAVLKIAQEIASGDVAMADRGALAKLACVADAHMRESRMYMHGAGLPEDDIFAATDSFMAFARNDLSRTTSGRWLSKSALEKSFDTLAGALESLGRTRPKDAAALASSISGLTPVQLSELEDLASVPYVAA